VFDAKAKWKFIGSSLGVPKSEIDSINSDNSNVDDKLFETLAKWLQSGKNTNWKTLAETLGSKTIGREDLKKIILDNHH